MLSALCTTKIAVGKFRGDTLYTLTRAKRARNRPLRWQSRMGHRLLAFCACLLALSAPAFGRDRWTELNIGPFRVDTDSAVSQARQTLATLEQLRWILGGMLENKDLEATWPFRVLLSASAPSPSKDGAAVFRLAHGQYIVALRPGSQPSYAEVARLFLEANTPRLPPEIDSALPRLFEAMEAHGAHVTWAKRPAKPDLTWARVQYFATRLEYSARFSIFINNLRGGSLLGVAEANAFGKDAKVLESEISSYLASGARPDSTISARPLDPKHDLGEHPLDDALAQLYLADTLLDSGGQRAEQSFKAAGNAGYRALAQEGMALLVLAENGDPREYLDGAIAAGSKNAWIYAKAAEDRSPPEATGLLKTARDLNPRWWLPAAELAKLAPTPAEKQDLLAEACQKNPRSAALWQQLAELQTQRGLSSAAQNSWIRAEDAAATPDERRQIHQRRQALENERLDAAEKAKRDTEEAARAEDARLQNEQLARIHAAEQRANEANNQSAGSSAGQGEVVHWWNNGENPVMATLLRVDCLGQQARLHVKSEAAKSLVLLVADSSKVQLDGPAAQLACGAQAPARKVSVIYKPRPDKKMGTSGDVVSIHFQ